MRLERRATTQCLLTVCNVFDEKTVRFKMITQHGAKAASSSTTKIRGLSKFDALPLLIMTRR